MQGSHGIYTPVEVHMVCCAMHFPASGYLQLVTKKHKKNVLLYQVQNNKLQGCFVFLFAWQEEINAFTDADIDGKREV